MIQVTCTWKGGNRILSLPGDESGFYKGIAELLLQIPIPNQLQIDCRYGSASYTIKKRGRYIKDGVEYPSMYVTEDYNTIIQLQPSSYEDAYLTCVNPESNNYKFYWLRPDANGVGATYGRIGSERGEAFGTKDLQVPYPSRMYWIRYYEKLSKGYVDSTDIYLCTSSGAIEETNASVAETPADHLYYQLYRYAKNLVQESLHSSKVTPAQIAESKRLLDELRECTGDEFNQCLLKLLAVCPRKVKHVNMLLAHSKKDYKEILEREENLVTAMEILNEGKPVENSGKSYFREKGVHVYLATDKQKEQVFSHLSDNLKQKVKTVYRIIPDTQQTRFNSYLKHRHIRKVKQLWHGSRNSNWLSIMVNGLKLNPEAPITGKMFGQGIYFAPSSEKSWGYTSYHNTYWANGSDDTAFMGLYATAYGHPLDVTKSQKYTDSMLQNMGKDCVHAHAGNQLYRDEIIYYNEDAMVLNYIVEFA